MASSSRRKILKKDLENSVLWREVHESSSEEESVQEEQQFAESSKKRVAPEEDVQPQKRRRRQASVESESGKDSSVDQDKEKDTANKNPGNRRKRKSAAADDSSHDQQSLIDVIKHQGKLVPRVVKNWVERYETDPQPALCELLMTIFEACGVKYLIEERSLDEIDVDDVVMKLVLQAKDGDVEDYLTSKQRDLRGFRDNLTAFWDAFVLESQNGPLFDQNLMDKCMNFVTALACSPPRNFRHVATLIGLQLVTSFISVAKTLCQSRETKQRQLNAEKKKRKDGPRVESLNKVLSETHSKITKVEEMMRTIFRGLFMHRYRDVDPDIRMACIRAIGTWIVSYPSFFLQDLYLKYLGWTLNDKNAAVRKSSLDALQTLYEVDDNVPSLNLFTTRFSNRMIEMADDIDINVAVSAIGLLKQLLRHQLIGDNELTPLYDLLIDESLPIRHAVGQLVYEQMIAMKSQPNSEDEDNDKSELQLKRLLTILKEFAGDPILCDYVIDAVWEEMKAMQDWKCLTSMLLDDTQSLELADVDTTNLCRILCGSVKKSVGAKMIPTTDNRKPTLSKSQKEALESNKKALTTVMIKWHSKLLRKYLADKAKVPYIVEIVQYMKLELYSLKQQEQNCILTLELIKDAFFKHGDKRTLRTCVNTLVFCANETQADLQDAAQRIFKETIDDVILKLRSAIEHAGETEDDYSLTVNLRRLQHLQLAVAVVNEALFKDMLMLLEDFSNLEDEVVQLVLLNMFLHMVWSLKGIDHDNPDDNQIATLISKRSSLLKHLDAHTDSVIESFNQGHPRCSLCCTICTIFSDLWSLFSEEKLSSTKIESLGFCPSTDSLVKFWELCQHRLAVTDKNDDAEEEEEADCLNQKDVVMTSAAKLIAQDMVPKDFLGPEIVSHYVLHDKGVDETLKQLIVILKKNMTSQELCSLYLEAMKKAYSRYMDEEDGASKTQSFGACKELASRLSATFSGFARNIHRTSILKLVKRGIDYAFTETPKHLSFLEACILPFSQRLPVGDIRDIVENVQGRVKDIDTDQDPSGWRPYLNFLEHLQERVAKTEAPGTKHDQPRTRSSRSNIKGKKLVDAPDESENEEEQSDTEEPDDAEQEDDDDTPLFQVRQAARLKSKEATTNSREENTHAMRTRKKAALHGSATATEEQLPE